MTEDKSGEDPGRGAVWKDVVKLAGEIAVIAGAVSGVAKLFEGVGPLRIPLWGAFVAVVVFLAVGVVLGRTTGPRRKGAEAESVRWYSAGGAGDAVAELLRTAEREVVIIGISNSAPLSDGLRTFVDKPDTRLDVYLPDPRCPGLANRAVDEGQPPEQFGKEVEAALTRLRPLVRRGVALHFYDWYPAWRVALIDGTAFVNTYPRQKGRRGNEVQVMRIDRQDSPRLFEQVLNLVHAYQRSATDVPEEQPVPAT